MATNGTAGRPDAFKAMMAAARAAGRPELAHQGRGRPLTQAEDDLAEALMEIYGQGITGQADLARALAARAVIRPSSGKPDWTADTLEAELQGINADLDAAYLEHGFGA
ncbi:recombinase-like helix-turn-helix domain-containing protein [Roseicyclus sp.]|uniref:recombinase-like helix-turn-helix domain-containing protein n=1 Tax=Roseicyclus sp. TaxID=1914329 RepID=UPI003FA0A03A